jgi:hypothetical protein
VTDRGGLLVLLAMAGVPAAQAQPSVITGRVFDSLRMAPLAGVSVQLSGTTLEARTGADGAYRLTTELKGRRTLILTEPRLDRLVGTVTSEVDLTPGSAVQFDFAIPRRPPAVSAVCTGDAAGTAGRGGVVGVVRDSATGLPISGALVAAFWIPDTPDTGGVRRGVRTESGEDGGFLLCSLPTDRPVALASRSPARELGLEGLRPGSGSIVDLDLLLRPLGEDVEVGRVRGRVTDSATGAPLAEADIMLLESGLHAISNASGDFAIEQVIPGRIGLVARRIGYRPLFLETALRAGGTATVAAQLRPAPVRLEDLETRVEAIERKDFLWRVRYGTGKYWDESEIRRFDGGSITALLGRKAELRERRGVLINHSRNRNCEIPVVIDGVLQGQGIPTHLRPEQLGAVEYYSGPAQVPNDFQSMHLRARGFGCGLLVLWTRGRE